MKVSFDFDGTLDKQYVQEYAIGLINRGVEVWVCTSRLSDIEAPSDKWNIDLYEVIKRIGIPKNRVKFCSMVDKYEFFIGKDFAWHLDDDWIELELINKHTKTIGISVFGQNNWIDKCDKYIK